MEVPRDENGNMMKVDGTTTGPLQGHRPVTHTPGAPR